MKNILFILLISPVVFSEVSTNDCEQAQLFFVTPQDGFISESQKFKVEFGSKNINVSPAGIVVEESLDCSVSGHHHLIINNAYDFEKHENQPIPFANNILHFGGGQKEAELTLPPGKYSLQLVIGDYEHKPINQIGAYKKYKPIASKQINIEIAP
tara:strand:+ start:276 stop:740 length:465 start_codon:yes stop_codon:yes gene_type:complete